MICSKYGLLTKPTLFNFLHEKLITLLHVRQVGSWK